LIIHPCLHALLLCLLIGVQFRREIQKRSSEDKFRREVQKRSSEEKFRREVQKRSSDFTIYTTAEKFR